MASAADRHWYRWGACVTARLRRCGKSSSSRAISRCEDGEDQRTAPRITPTRSLPMATGVGRVRIRLDWILDGADEDRALHDGDNHAASRKAGDSFLVGSVGWILLRRARGPVSKSAIANAAPSA